ncbi:MAG: DNA repair protein RecO [Verrucomicrobiota bacterium]
MFTIHKCEGIVIRIIPYSESSLITTWFTDSAGIIQLIARGAKRKKQHNYDPIDLLNFAEVSYRSNERKQIHTAQQIQVKESNRDIAVVYSKLLTLIYFFEVLAQLVETNTPLPEQYILFTKAIDYMKTNKSSQALVERYERRLLTSLGLPHESLSIEQARAKHYSKRPKSWASLQKHL